LPSALISDQFPTFFQAFWLGPVDGLPDRLMGFHGTAEGFSWVIREAEDGIPLANLDAALVSGGVELDLAQWMPDNTRNAVLYLFGSSSEAATYYAQISGGWTKAEKEIIKDTPSLIPDVSAGPQQQVRALRLACNPSVPASVAHMNAELLVNYQKFTDYDGLVLPEVTNPGLKGLLIAAPGNPPEWIPP
jgi:hypothetical protein